MIARSQNCSPPSSGKSRLWLTTAAIALVLSVGSGVQASWIYGKAVVAQLLLESAWRESLIDKQAHVPWSWADIHPVARLDIEDTDNSYMVLSDASGEAMAFGPGLVAGDINRASDNTIALGGHRDTHLSFLEHLPIGAHVNVQNMQGQLLRYELLDKTVIDSRIESIEISKNTPGLVLITCYPFNAIQTGGPFRLIAKARLIPAQVNLNRPSIDYAN